MLIFLILSLIFLITRLLNLTLLPVFADEAIYIHWAQVIWHDAANRFIPLSDGKPPLFMWLMVPFLKVFSDPLLAGRLLSVSSGLSGLIGVYLLTEKLFSRKVAILASIFVILQPFLLFYDRLAVVDSMLTTFGVWSFYAAYLLFEKPTIGKGVILGTLWGGAILTKPTGIYFPLLTPAFIFLFPFKKWPDKIKKLFIPSVLASGYALGFFNVLRLSPAFHMLGSRSADYMRTTQEFLTNSFEYIPDTAKVMFLWLVSYFSWWMIPILAAGLISALKKRKKEIGLLFLWIAAPFLVQVLIGKIIYPRYLLITVPFFLIILSWAILEIFKTPGVIRVNNTRCLLAFLLLGGMVANWLYFSFWLLTNPAKAPLDHAEKEQYLYEWSAGFGIREIANYLKSLPKDKKIAVGTEGYFGTLPNGLQIYLDGEKNIDIFGVGQPIVSFNQKLLDALGEGKEVYLVVNNTRFKIKQDQMSQLKLIGEYKKPKGPKGEEKLLFFKFLSP